MASASSQLIDGLGRALLVNWLNLDNIIDGDKLDFETAWGNVTGTVNDLFQVVDETGNPVGISKQVQSLRQMNGSGMVRKIRVAVGSKKEISVLFQRQG